MSILCTAFCHSVAALTTNLYYPKYVPDHLQGLVTSYLSRSLCAHQTHLQPGVILHTKIHSSSTYVRSKAVKL